MPVVLAGACALALLALAGCATARGGPPGDVDASPAALETECREAAARAAGFDGGHAALKTGTLAGLYLALNGASSGAWWGFITGGSAGSGAWIGAAAGAGAGAVIGLVHGVATGLQAHQRYRQTYEECLAGRRIGS